MNSVIPNEILSADELVGLTRRYRPTAQVRALRLMKIPHVVRVEGSVVVYRSSLHQQEVPISNRNRKEVDRVAVEDL